MMINHNKKISVKHILTFITSISIFIILICSNIIFSTPNDKSNQPSKDNTNITVPEENNNTSVSHNVLLDKDNKTNKEDTYIEVTSKKKEISEKTKPVEYTKKQQSENIIQTNYIDLYPELYCTRSNIQTTPDKTIFLTFDDGPSERTAEILDILNKENVKATFFVTGKNSPESKALMKRIVNEGHTIAIHTYSHVFNQIYKSVKDYLDDFYKIYNLIYETTEVKVNIFRFPGGSKNSYNKNNYREFITEMTRRGFDYFDWNLSIGDAVSKNPTPTKKCISNVLNSSSNYNNAVVLMHDSKPKHTTVEALPFIIDGLRKQGFTFDKLSHDINPAPYSMVKPYK